MKSLIRLLFSKAEELLKTDLKYLTKSGAWLFLGRASFLLNGLILSVAFANLLPQSAYGTYQFLLTASSIIGAFTLSGMGIAVSRAAARGEDGMLRYGFRVKRLWSVSILIIASAVSIYYLVQGNLILSGSFLIIALTVPLIESFRLYQQYLLGKGFFKEATRLGIFCRSITPISLLLALFLTDSPLILVAIFFGTTLLGTAVSYHLTVKRYQLPIHSDENFVTYSKQLSVLTILKMLANHIDKIILFQSLGAVTLATYTIANLPTTHLLKVWGMIGQLAFPRFAKRKFSIVQNKMLRKLVIFTTLTIVAIILLILVLPFIYKILFPAYPESVFMAQVILINLLFKPLTLITQAFEAHKKISQQRFTVISSLLIKMLLIVALTYLYGVWGAIFATILANMCWSFIVVALFYQSKLKF